MPTTKKPGALFALFLALVMGALLWLLTTARDYYRFTLSTVEGAASATPLRKEALLKTNQHPQEPFNTEIKYRTFFLTQPGAEKVELVADFNRWGKDPLVLHNYKKNYFEISVALTSGEYKYAFLVDGKRMMDPTNMDRQMYNGQEVCIKTVR